MATICQDSQCEEGGDGICCHECDKFDGCRSSWRCDDPTFYEDCKVDGGVTCILDWEDKIN